MESPECCGPRNSYTNNIPGFGNLTRIHKSVGNNKLVQLIMISTCCHYFWTTVRQFWTSYLVTFTTIDWEHPTSTTISFWVLPTSYNIWMTAFVPLIYLQLLPFMILGSKMLNIKDYTLFILIFWHWEYPWNELIYKWNNIFQLANKKLFIYIKLMRCWE